MAEIWDLELIEILEKYNVEFELVDKSVKHIIYEKLLQKFKGVIWAYAFRTNKYINSTYITEYKQDSVYYKKIIAYKLNESNLSHIYMVVGHDLEREIPTEILKITVSKYFEKVLNDFEVTNGFLIFDESCSFYAIEDEYKHLDLGGAAMHWI